MILKKLLKTLILVDQQWLEVLLKNFDSVIIVTDVADYDLVLNNLKMTQIQLNLEEI